MMAIGGAVASGVTTAFSTIISLAGLSVLHSKFKKKADLAKTYMIKIDRFHKKAMVDGIIDDAEFVHFLAIDDEYEESRKATRDASDVDTYSQLSEEDKKELDRVAAENAKAKQKENYLAHISEKKVKKNTEKVFF